MTSSNWVFGNLDNLRNHYQSDIRIDNNMYILKSLFLYVNGSERRLIIDHTKSKNVGSISGYAIEHIFRPSNLKEYTNYIIPLTPRDVTIDSNHKKMKFMSPPWYKFWKRPKHVIQIDRIYGDLPRKINYMLSYPFYDHIANRICWVMPFSPYE